MAGACSTIACIVRKHMHTRTRTCTHTHTQASGLHVSHGSIDRLLIWHKSIHKGNYRVVGLQHRAFTIIAQKQASHIPMMSFADRWVARDNEKYAKHQSATNWPKECDIQECLALVWSIARRMKIGTHLRLRLPPLLGCLARPQAARARLLYSHLLARLEHNYTHDATTPPLYQ